MNSHASGEEAECTAMNAVRLMAQPHQVLPSLFGLLNSLSDGVPPDDLCDRTMERVDQDRLELERVSLPRKAS